MCNELDYVIHISCTESVTHNEIYIKFNDNYACILVTWRARFCSSVQVG